jgi:dephospho-CoA kinase
VLIVGITGKYCAGKGTVAEYLVKEKNFKHFSVREYITQHERLNPSAVDYREQLIAAGNKIRKEHGASFIIEELYKQALKEGVNAVIESIRCPNELKYIKKNGGIIFGVDADPEIRFNRSKKRKDMASKFTSVEDMLAKEKLEESLNPDEQNLSKCFEMADHQFINNETKKELYNQIENYYKIIGVEGSISNREREC